MIRILQLMGDIPPYLDYERPLPVTIKSRL
jgi:hypothetical protein